MQNYLMECIQETRKASEAWGETFGLIVSLEQENNYSSVSLVFKTDDTQELYNVTQLSFCASCADMVKAWAQELVASGDLTSYQ